MNMILNEFSIPFFSYLNKDSVGRRMNISLKAGDLPPLSKTVYLQASSVGTLPVLCFQDTSPLSGQEMHAKRQNKYM